MPFEITQVFTYYAQIYASYAYIVSSIVINTSPSKMKLAFSSGVRYLGGGGQIFLVTYMCMHNWSHSPAINNMGLN